MYVLRFIIGQMFNILRFISSFECLGESELTEI